MEKRKCVRLRTGMRNLLPKSDLLKILSVVTTIPATFLLYFGMGALFIMPGFPGEAFLTPSRLRLAVPPLCGSIALLLLAAWFWSRAIDADSLWDSVGLVVLRAVGAIVVAGVAMMLWAKLHGWW